MIEPTWTSDCCTVRLWNRCCLEVMASWPDGAVDAVVTDPPYGINTKSDGSGKLSPWADLCNSAFWYAAWMREVRRVSRALWSFFNWRSVVTFQKASCDIRWPIESLLVWDKCWIGPGGQNGLRPSYELVGYWYNGRGVVDRGLPDIQRWPWSSSKPHHPAEKPVESAEWMIEAVRGQTIADPFMGSGTTGVAAVRLGRQFWGVEIDPDYFAIATRRIQDELRRVEFLEGKADKPRQAELFTEASQ